MDVVVKAFNRRGGLTGVLGGFSGSERLGSVNFPLGRVGTDYLYSIVREVRSRVPGDAVRIVIDVAV